MKINHIVSAIMLLPLTSLGWAGEMGSQPVNTWDRVITLSGGPAWTNPGQMQQVMLLPFLSQLYVTQSNTQTIGSGEVALSLQHPLKQHIKGQIGLAVAAATSIPLSGEIWQDNDPDFNNFNYAYKINHAHIAIRGKLFADYSQFIQPYLSASLGLGFNQAYNYSDTPKLPEVVSEPPFQKNTNTVFVYTLDAGIQRVFYDLWTIGIGYEFADWGKSQLSGAMNQRVGSGLAVNHIYINQLLISLSFIA